MSLDVNSLWCATHNRTTWGIRACKLTDALKAANRELVEDRELTERVIAVCESLEQAWDYVAAIKRILKRKHHEEDKREEGGVPVSGLGKGDEHHDGGADGV